MTRDEFEEKLFAVASSWVGVGFLHNGRTRSQGVDCLGLIICMYQDMGFFLPDGDGHPYQPDWYLHTPEPRYLEGLFQNGTPVFPTDLLPGDVVYFRPGVITMTKSSKITHGGVVLRPPEFIHAITGRRVEIAHLTDRAWTKSYAGAVRPHVVLSALGEKIT